MPELSDALLGISSRELLTYTLAYSVRCPQVAHIAIERLTPLDFDESTQLDFMVVWHVARLYWIEYGQVPPHHYLRGMAVAVLQQRGYQEPVYHEGVQRLVDAIYTITDLSNADYGQKLLHAFFNDVFNREIKQLAEQPADRTDMAEEVTRRAQRLTIDSIERIDPFDLQIKPSFPRRQPTGTSFVDRLLGGGLLPAETIGLLGPSGGGKTLLALQVGCSLAERRLYVEYFTYEQPAKDLQIRVLSCAGQVDSKELKGKEWHEVDSTTRQRVERVAKASCTYLHLLDRSSEGHSVTEIASHVKSCIAAGKKPTLVVVDWIWPLVVRMAARSSRRNVDERKLLMSVMEDIKAVAADTGVCFLIVHQLSTEIAKKAPGRKPQWFNSAEAGAFAWFLPYCFAIGTADANGYCWLVGSKARHTSRKELLVRLNGAYNRFMATDSAMTYDAAKREFIEQDQVGKMPGMSEKKPADAAYAADADADETDCIAGVGGVQS